MGSSGLHFTDDAKRFPIAGTLKENEVANYKGTAANIGGGAVETAQVFTKDGEPIIGFLGERHSVGVDNKYLQDGAILTHLHPNNEFGGTLSIQDLRMLASDKTDLSEVRAYSKQGKVYSAKLNTNADKARIRKFLNSMAGTGKKEGLMTKNFRNAYEKALKQASAKPIVGGKHDGKIRITSPSGKVNYVNPMTPAQAEKYARTYSVGVYDRFYKKNLAKYGITYSIKNV